MSAWRRVGTPHHAVSRQGLRGQACLTWRACVPGVARTFRPWPYSTATAMPPSTGPGHLLRWLPVLENVEEAHHDAERDVRRVAARRVEDFFAVPAMPLAPRHEQRAARASEPLPAIVVTGGTSITNSPK